MPCCLFFFVEFAWLALATPARTPPEVFFFDLDEAVTKQSLDYEEQLVAFVFEGLVNQQGDPNPTVCFNYYRKKKNADAPVHTIDSTGYVESRLHELRLAGLDIFICILECLI